MREIQSGSGYLSQNELRILFGLGNRTIVDKMEIRWPSGEEEQMERIRANQLIVVTENKEGKDGRMEGWK